VTNPLFTDENPKNAPAAYKHNRPFAKPGPYQTALNDVDEQAFRQWLRRYKVEFDPDNPQENYDMRGFWKDTKGQAPKDFYPDTYKTPWDTTFSNESRYATSDCPFRWKDAATLIDIRDGSTVFFNPSHYASEPAPQGPRPQQFPEWDTPATQSGYGTRWHLEVKHANGTVSPLPLKQISSGKGETHWGTDYVLQPGEQVLMVTPDSTTVTRSA
jgi:hypothetical protein